MTLQRGFTLTELVVTVAIVGVLGTVAAVSLKPESTVTGMTTDLAYEHRHVRNFTAGGATSADAIASGFPPDFRGRIISKYKVCPGYEGSELPPGTDLGFPCVKFRASDAVYLEVQAQRLKAGGGLETLSTTRVPSIWSSNDSAMAYVYYTPDANLTQGIACSGTACSVGSSWTSLRGPFEDKYLDYYAMLGTHSFGDTSDITLRCYYNGTCDPITYWFVFKDGEQYRFNRLVITPTGSVASIPSWGPL